jgi:hypothetical protein
MITKLVTAILCFTVIIVFQCTGPTEIGKGGTSETVNAKVIFTDTTIAVIHNGTVGDKFSLNIYSTSFKPYENYGFIDSVVNSISDTLHWIAPSNGDYNILLKASPWGDACFLRDITLTSGMLDTIDCVLGPCFNLIGVVEPGDSGVISENYALSIYGTPFFAVVDSLNHFAINGVPSGIYTLSLRSTTKRLFKSTLNYSITADSIRPTTNLRLLIK